VLAIIVVVNYILVFSRAYSIGISMLVSSKRIHNIALKGITLAESVFFDKNPTGRMLNRFSKDTVLMDEMLNIYFYELINTSCSLIGNIVVLAIVAPPNLAVIFAFMVYVYFLVKKVAPITKALRRIELISRSPILSLCNASALGLVTIRALGLEEKFRKDMKSSVTFALKSLCSYMIAVRFYQGYCEFGALFVNILNVLILVLYKDNINSGLAGMSISLTISVAGLVTFWSKCLVETDNYMASPQRLIEYADIPNEGEYEMEKPFIINKGRIEIRELYMKYRENYENVLQNLSVIIEEGKKVGIIGRTGGWKIINYACAISAR